MSPARQRVHNLRRRVIAAAVALFVALFSGIGIQLASGHDPALKARSAVTTPSSGTATSSGTTTSSGTASSSGTATSSGTTSSAERTTSQSTTTLPPVTTSQS